jgi:hypothetical protein
MIGCISRFVSGAGEEFRASLASEKSMNDLSGRAFAFKRLEEGKYFVVRWH